MKLLHVRNATRDASVCPRCGLADTFWTRVRGLMGRPSLDPDEGLWIVSCPSIHMFNMKFAIDVIFLTRDRVVTDFVENIGPGKTYVARNGAGKPHSAVEVAPGTVARTGTQIGDVFEFLEE